MLMSDIFQHLKHNIFIINVYKYLHILCFTLNKSLNYYLKDLVGLNIKIPFY